MRHNHVVLTMFAALLLQVAVSRAGAQTTSTLPVPRLGNVSYFALAAIGTTRAQSLQEDFI